MQSVMKKGDKHYIIFFNDKTIALEYSLSHIFRNDILFIIERTYEKKSSGMGIFYYFDNKILDSKKNIVDNNIFIWGNIKAKLKNAEHYGVFQYYLKEPKVKSTCLFIEVEDRLGQKCTISFRTDHYDKTNKEILINSVEPFYKIKEDLDLLNRVGTCEALFEIKRLEDKIDKLMRKIK